MLKQEVIRFSVNRLVPNYSPGGDIVSARKSGGQTVGSIDQIPSGVRLEREREHAK